MSKAELRRLIHNRKLLLIIHDKQNISNYADAYHVFKEVNWELLKVHLKKNNGFMKDELKSYRLADRTDMAFLDTPNLRILTAVVKGHRIISVYAYFKREGKLYYVLPGK